MNEITMSQQALEHKDLSVCVKKYAPLVKRIAFHMMARLPNHIQVDDLIQSGMLGLLDALKNFDESKGASFSTYAGIRIRGAILDDMRRSDWTPRSVHRNSRRVSAAIYEVEKRTKRNARDEEIAAEMSMSLQHYYELLHEIAGARMFAFEEAGINNHEVTHGLSARILGPDESLQISEQKRLLAEKISKIPSREQLVLALYYKEELNLKEIGKILSVSESRACQLLSQANARLRSKLDEWNKML